MRRARPRDGKPRRQPVRCIRPGDGHALGRRRPQRRLGARQSIGLIRPDIGEQAGAILRRRRIAGRDVATRPVDHPQTGAGRRRAAPFRAQRDARIRRTERAASKVQPIAIAEEIDPGARAEFREDQRQPGQRRDRHEAGNQNRGAAHFVGLRGRAQPVQDRRRMIVQRIRNRRPERRVIAGGVMRRIDGSCLRSRPGQAVQRAGEPERDRIAARGRLARPVQNRAPDSGCAIETRRRQIAQPRREGRAEISAGARLRPEGVAHDVAQPRASRIAFVIAAACARGNAR